MSIWTAWRVVPGSALVALLAGGAAAQEGEKKGPRKAPEPIIKGQPLGHWVTQSEGKDVAGRIAALGALAQGAGPEAGAAAPALVGVLRDGPTFLHPLAAVALAKIGEPAVADLLKGLEDRQTDVRTGSALAFSLMGPRGAKGVPGLAVRVVKDPESLVRSQSAGALGQIGVAAKVALPDLEGALKDVDPAVRVEAASALWRVGRQTRTGVPVLVAALESKAGERAAQVLGEVGPDAKSASSALEAAVAGKDERLAGAAAEALGRVTGAWESPRRALRRLAVSKDDEVRQRAARSLGDAPPDEESAAALVALLADAEPTVRREAACALAGLGEGSRLKPDALRPSLGDADAGVRWWTALAWLAGGVPTRGLEEEVLSGLRAPFDPPAGEKEGPGTLVLQVQAAAAGRAGAAIQAILTQGPAVFRPDAAAAVGLLGPDARPALPGLLEALKGEDRLARRSLADALGQVGAEGVAVLTKALSSEDARVREGAARALGATGRAAAPAVPALRRLLKDDDANVRVQAAGAVWRLERSAEQPLAILGPLLKDVDNPDRWEIIEVLTWIALEARPAVRGLTEVLLAGVKDRDARVRALSVRGLWLREQQARNVLPLLRDLATDRDPFVRLTVLRTVGEMTADGPTQPAAVALLIAAFDDRDVAVRQAASAALVTAGKEVVPDLVKALGDKNPRTRSLAARTLGRLGPAGKEAAAALRKLADDPDEGVKAAAGEAARRVSRPE